MVKMIFISDPTPREGGDFKTGKTYEMTETSAARWIKRGRAMTLDDYKLEQKTENKKSS